MNRIIEYVQLDDRDKRPSNLFPTRHGGIDPVVIEQVLQTQLVRVTNEQYPNGYDYALIIGTTNDHAQGVKGVIRELDADEIAALLADLKDKKLAEINSMYSDRVSMLEADYPASERESWHVQTDEAKQLLADPEAITPWIDAAAQGRGVTREELAQLIAEQDSQYRMVHGTLTGLRQLYRDQLEAMETPTEVVRFTPTFNAELS